MTLDEYLIAEKERGLTETAFGAKVGLSQPQINRLRKAKSWPGRELMARIRQATDQKVTPNDWVPPLDMTAPLEASGEAA